MAAGRCRATPPAGAISAQPSALIMARQSPWAPNRTAQRPSNLLAFSTPHLDASVPKRVAAVSSHWFGCPTLSFLSQSFAKQMAVVWLFCNPLGANSRVVLGCGKAAAVVRPFCEVVNIEGPIRTAAVSIFFTPLLEPQSPPPSSLPSALLSIYPFRVRKRTAAVCPLCTVVNFRHTKANGESPYIVLNHFIAFIVV